MNKEKKHPKFSVSLLLVVLVFEVIFIRLAVWQYSRMNEKEIAFNTYEEKLNMIPENFDFQEKYKNWDIVQIEGQFNYDEEKLLQTRHYKSYRGYRLITPLVLKNGSTVLVDRGWIPDSYDSANPKELQDSEREVSFTGVVREIPKKKAWLKGPVYGTTKRVIKRIDVGVFESEVTYKNFLIQANSSGNKNIKSFVEKPRSGAKHLEYLITWLALAIILPGLYGALLWQTKKRV